MPKLGEMLGEDGTLNDFFGTCSEKINGIDATITNDFSVEDIKKYSAKYPYEFRKYTKIPCNIDNSFNLVTFLDLFDVPYEKSKEYLRNLNDVSAKLNQTEMIYTDEEIEAISKIDYEKCQQLFINKCALKGNDNNYYTPEYVYINTMEQLDKVGIKAEDLLNNADIYAEFGLNNESCIAFQNKIAKYAVYQAQLGKLTGEIKLPALATYKAPEKVKDATFSVNENSTMVVEEFMPSVGVTSGGGDELGSFYSGVKSKFGAYPAELTELVGKDKFYAWTEELDVDKMSTDKAIDITKDGSLLSYVIKFDVSSEDMKKALTNITNSQLTPTSELCYTTEEIEAIASRNIEKCRELFIDDMSICVNDIIYPTAYLYSNTMEQLDKVGIKAEDLLKNADAYAKLNLSEKAKIAFLNKIAKYAVYQAQLGKLKGDIKLPALATYKAPEKVKDATFSVNENSTMVVEEFMPSVDVTSGGGDELRAFMEIYADKISTIPGLLLDTVSSDEQTKWKKKYSETFEKQTEIPNNIDNTLSVVTFFIDFDISYEKGKQLLTELNTANEKYNQTELMYTKEEIEAICTKDLEKCEKLFLNDNAIKASDGNNYTPKYVYSNTMEQLDKVGIKAEDLLKNADAYAKLNLSDEAKTAFQNKIAKYAVYQAQLGKLTGEIKLPALATYKAPEKVKDATFSV